jgi:hypothetical protein
VGGEVVGCVGWGLKGEGVLGRLGCLGGRMGRDGGREVLGVGW